MAWKGSTMSWCRTHDQPAIQTTNLRWRRTLTNEEVDIVAELGFELVCETGKPYPDDCRMVSDDPNVVVGLALLSQLKKDTE